MCIRDSPTIANPTNTTTSSATYKVVTSLDDNGTLCKDSSFYVVIVTPQISIINNGP